LFIYSPNTDGFYVFHISQGSVATQLRCGDMFSNHFITNFPQMRQWKNFENRSIFHQDMDKTLWLTFFGPSCSWWRL